MTLEPLKIGFIGLGVMGTPMCLRLAAARHHVFVRTRGRVPEDIVASRATICTTNGGVAERADVIFMMVPDTPDVEEVLFGPSGVAASLTPGKIVVDMSSISPAATKEFARRVRELGASYLDAPVSGGEVGAREGTLSIMVGGEAEVFEKVEPLLKVLGRNIRLVGGNGDGQTAKVANQIIVGLTIEAVAEGLLFASRAGADPAKVREALLGGFAASRVLEVHGDRMIKREFKPGFRIELHRKDLGLALSNAREYGLSLPNTEAVQALFENCMQHGQGRLDHSALLLALEQTQSQ